MTVREQFKELVKEYDYQKEFTYEQRTELFNKLIISTSANFFNPLMALSTYLLSDGYVSREWDLMRHGHSHSGAVMTAFNKDIKENKFPYVDFKEYGKYDRYDIKHYRYNNPEGKKFETVMMFVVYDDGCIRMKFMNKEFWANPDICYYRLANDFVEALGMPRFFNHKKGHNGIPNN